MADAILSYFGDLGSNNLIFIILLVAMIPVIELKGAIPFGASIEIWGAKALSVWESFLYAYIGTTLISIIIILLYKKVLDILLKWNVTKNFATKIIDKLNGHKDEIDGQVKSSKINKRLAKALAIGTFVAVPLPLTGVWTGAALCTVLKMPVLDSILSVVLGNLICGLIVTLVSKQFEAYTHIILIAVLALALVLFIGRIVVSKIKKSHAKNKEISIANDSIDGSSIAENTEEN
ncbi:MAG: small multi-drug export protein [Clostridia bacterium]|nr:small multi-drug export protein [Clostridia bacterium]